MHFALGNRKSVTLVTDDGMMTMPKFVNEKLL